MTHLEILKAARALITDPQNWTQVVSARASDSKSVDFNSPEATCWCISGAFYKVSDISDYTTETQEAFHTFTKANLSYVAEFNDSHTHQEVLHALDKAIASASS